MSTTKYTIWLLLFLCSGCYREVAMPVTAGFAYEAANGFTVPVEISFKNTSTGAETFEWTFEGGEPATSKQANPANILYRKAGTYTVRLIARNFDGVTSTSERKIIIDAQLDANFSAAIQGNSYSPVVVSFTNLSKGFDKAEWLFEGGTPAISEQANPVVTFENGGSHKVTLKISNSRHSFSKDTTLVFEPELTADFAIKIPKQYEELEAPAELEFINRSVGNIADSWSVTGAEINNDRSKNTLIKFTKAGTYTVQLQTGNGKKTRQTAQTITIKPSKGYAYIKDAELGIFPARSSIGIFYSTTLRQTFQVTDSLTTMDAGEIDFLFYGLNEDFNFNRFLSPLQTSLVGLPALKNASATIIVNPAYVPAGIDFNALDAAKLQSLQVKQANGSKDDFFSEESPGIILFENARHKKGAILIKEFIHEGEKSRIRVDIKVLK
jgi:PKD repeat protein